LLAVSASACGPLASFRPPSALEGPPVAEVGAGIAAVGPRPYVEESTQATGQLWASLEAEPWLTLSTLAAFDDEAALGGVTVLAKPLRADRFVAGVEVEAGFAWGAVALPASVRLFDRTWLYTAPRFHNWADEISFGVPFGLSAGLLQSFDLRLEGQISWAELVYYNRRIHFGGAAVYHW
jgi:hypothetical protein